MLHAFNHTAAIFGPHARSQALLDALLRAAEPGAGAIPLAENAPSLPAEDPRTTTEHAAEIRAARHGDHDAFARIIQRYQQRIAHTMRRFTRDPQQLEELVHDVFVQAYFSLHTYRAKAPFEHWLRRIAIRVGYRHWKSLARNPRPLDDAHEPAGTPPRHDALDRAEQDVLLHRLLERLKPADRLVLTLLHLEQYPVAEVAQMTGRTRTAVKVSAHRARRRLAALLAQHGFEP